MTTATTRPITRTNNDSPEVTFDILEEVLNRTIKDIRAQKPDGVAIITADDLIILLEKIRDHLIKDVD